ncbi:oxygen-independent coproporphyrinogen III oxidase [Spirosoma horti]
MTTSLIAKYNVAGPRYTSYPTVPFWNTDAFTNNDWQQHLTTAFAESNYASGISLYIHLPYCESLCTFCGCNKRITRNHGVEKPYIDTLLAEYAMYCDWFSRSAGSERPRIAELHLGGGTPSFFSPEQLRRLLTGLFQWADPTDEPDFGWEGHPNNTTREHLQTLYNFGFRRVSFGVQDYDPAVQLAIHRHQPFANVKRVTDQARAIGYTSISHDLVFGLPFQRPESIQKTIAKTLTLRPDRISFYSYAHVPWIKGNGQRGFRDEDLPTGDAKRELYELGRDLLQAGGYTEIGMDHFALPHDPLYKAMESGRLHRNFMGYTTTQTDVLLGLGVSAISDVGTAFMQNEKDIDSYQQRVLLNKLPILRGHSLTEEDTRIRRLILDIMCRFKTRWAVADWTDAEWDALRQKLDEFHLDGLLDYDETSLRVRPAGHPFLRNICMAFDRHLIRSQRTERLFSQTV